MKSVKKIMLLLLLSVSTFAAQAQVKEESLMRSSGRIYVVIAVILTILAGLILYLVRLEKKIGKLEKSQKS